MCTMAWKVGVAALKLLAIMLAMTQMLGASALLFRGNVATLANARRVILRRRLSYAGSEKPLLPSSNPLSPCLEIGPVCPDAGFVECAVGGVVGCLCAFIRDCEPGVSNCYFKDARGVPSYCGF